MRFALVAVMCLGTVGCMEAVQAGQEDRAVRAVNGRGLAAVLVGLGQETVHAPPAAHEKAGPSLNEELRSPPQIEESRSESPRTVGITPQPAPAVLERRQVLAFVRNRPVQRCDGRRCTFDASERDACAGLTREFEALRGTGWKVEATGGHVHVVDIDAWPDAARQWGVTTAPTFVLSVNRRPAERVSGALSARQIAAFYSTGATGVATFPPHERWRSALPAHVAERVSNEVEADVLQLPTMRINLLGQALEFVDSRESRLNRWFSVAFRSGSVKHSGSSVTFSAPPELRLHVTETGAGVLLDSLQSIEFTPTGANLHLVRLGSIPIRVTGGRSRERSHEAGNRE
ncbi:MAG TPA: thioredoxin family protein [Planctomycetaceae bacterium]|nr:thioredoxin family protein [Planctomycetaceae bacterium]